jgi:prenyltransferase beta subunit
MSFRLEMLQVARVAPKALGESAGLVAAFLRSQFSSEGGFVDRNGKPDLYYSVFGIEGLVALREELPIGQIASWLSGYGDGGGLDFVHLCCLARCWRGVDAKSFPIASREALAARIEQYRTPDGGYHQSPGKAGGSAYGALLAGSAYEDLELGVPNPEMLALSMISLQTADGAFSNERGQAMGSTTATSAAAAFYRHAGMTVPGELRQWLLRQCLPDGGFLAFPKAPMPDLLSTAVALHALSGMQADIGGIRESCLDFVDSLWSAEGGFHGHWADDMLDCEYTYYGLLALGHLTV